MNTAWTGDPYPWNWGGYQPIWNVPFTTAPDWIIRKCSDCAKEFPVTPREGEPFPERCNPCDLQRQIREEEASK